MKYHNEELQNFTYPSSYTSIMVIASRSMSWAEHKAYMVTEKNNVTI
jgi:hypothetical protein